MLRQRYLVLSIWLGAACVCSSLAQEGPLVIAGTVLDVRPTGMPVKNGDRYELQDRYFEINLRLTYTNTGDETLIVPLPMFFFGSTRKVLFLDIPSASAKAALTTDEYHTYEMKGRNEFLRKQLATDEPSQMFAVIEPGRSCESGALISVRSGYELVVTKKGGRYERDIEAAIPEYAAFKVQFQSSLRGENGSTEPLREAQDRWKRFGKLLLTSSGDLFQESNVIINKP